MGDIPGDGKVRVDFVLAIANIFVPTASELNAGLRISQWMPADGLVGFRPETADVGTSGIEDDFDTNTNGRRSFSGTLVRLKKQTGSDAAYTTMLPDVEGFLVIRRSIAAATAYVSGQHLQGVYPVICGETAWMDPEPNTIDRYEVPLKLRLKPALRVNVA
ncbi:phage tail tube protein [Micromonospora okii]|uniref:phage tail tube protein n=1 Tax=Micromonospora okii TaxID=1182970 RepID=UPI001E28ECB6|nr:hypothetical protein [Micromonospora okii]